MSTSGQADQSSETHKDEEPEISSTTSENEGLKETVGKSNQNSADAAIDPEDTQTSEAVKIVTSHVPSSFSNEISITDAVMASTAPEIQERSEIMHDSSKLRVVTDCDVGSTTVSLPKAVVSVMTAEAGSSGITRETGIGSPKPGALNYIPEKKQAECDKDSSFEEDLVLRWDEDDDVGDGATEPQHTDYVLEMLNKELGEDVIEKPDTLKPPKITSEEGSIKSVNNTKLDKKEEKDVIKSMTANDSFRESQKIIPEIDSLTQDEIDKTINVNHNKTSKDAVELEKQDIEKSEPVTLSIELPLKTLTKENEEMDVDDSGNNITQKKEIKEKSDVLNVAVTVNDSIEDSQKIIAEIDSLTQDGQFHDKITHLSTENPGELVNQLENNKTPTDAVKLELELTKKVDVDDSGDITQEKEIKEKSNLLNVAVSISDSCEQSQKIVPQLNSLTRDEIDKTAALPTVTADSIDKQLENFEISKDESIKSENPNMEELVTTTVSIEIPFKPLTDDEMDIDKSGENIKEKEELIRTATVSFEECQKTIADSNSLDQDDKIEKTGDLPSESNNQPVDKLDKQLDYVEILMNESEKPDIEESKPETKVVEVLSELLSKDDEEMDLDDSNDVDKDTSTVDDFTAKVSKPQENTSDSVEKDKVESIKDKEVLDNVEDKQDISNISHDIIAEVLKPAETVTSEYDISSTDKTILKKDIISTQDKAIEDITEISQPVDDKNKENDSVDIILDLDDKQVQSIDNKTNDTQKNYETATSLQDDKKSSDEHSTHKFSESQANDDKVTSTQEIDDKTTEANENIFVKTETKDQSGVNASMIDDSLIDTTISPNKHHRINKPNVMLDIPTQEFSDIEAELSDSEINDDIENPAENTKSMENPTNMDETTAESNKIVKVMPEISRTATPTIEIDATTSKLNITTVSPIKLNPASSKDVEKSDDDNLSSFKQVEQPSTDIGDEAEKLTTDDADEVQESDTLGLLAESTRVPMNTDDDIDDDEDEAEELEADDNENDNDNDDDEDFDPFDESNSQMLEDLVDTDDSNPATQVKALKSKVIDGDEQTNKKPDEQPDRITNILERVLGNKSELKQPSVGSILNYVEVEGSSDSDDIEEISNPAAENLISVKVPAEVDVMLTSGAEGGTSAMHSNKDEVVISVPKPQSLKVAKINTSEVTIKSASKNLESIQIPETRSISEKNVDEVFDIDSDDEEEKIEDLPKGNKRDISPSHPLSPKPPKCINPHCTDASGAYSKASRATVAYYSLTRRSGVACQPCTERAGERSQALVNGIKDLRPLMELEMGAPSHQLVEISDSDEDEEPVDESEKIGEKGAKLVLDNLVDVINEAWLKYDMEGRLKETEAYLNEEIDLIAAGAEELNKLLDDVQMKTDAIRTDFYKDYYPRIKHTGGIVIHDTPFRSYTDTEKEVPVVKERSSNRYPKRRSASTLSDPPAKKHAVSLTSPDKEKKTLKTFNEPLQMDDDKELTVVKLTAESAPESLPPLGELVRPPLCAGMSVYAMRHAFGTWNKAKILEIVQEASPPTVPFTQCRVKFEHKVKSSCKVLAARCIAYSEPSEVRYGLATRVVALFKDPQSTRMDAYYAGVVAEIPNPVNNYRYLIFFDDGYAQYVQHADTRLVCQASALVWEEVHPFIRDFVRNYFKAHPAKAMVRLKEGGKLKTEWNGKWWSSQVLKVDASIALIHFDHDNRTEWIYRGSSRLEPLYLELLVAKAGAKNRSRLPTNRLIRSNMPCVEYTRSGEEEARAVAEGLAQNEVNQPSQNEQVRPERAVAKKSTTDRRTQPGPLGERVASSDQRISRVVYYTPKYATKPLRMEPHTCSPACGRRADILPLHQLRTYNPLSKPLLSGWERQTIRYNGSQRAVAYRAPCGRRLRNMEELHRWLCIQESELSVDLFDFTPGTHCLAEFCLDKIIVGKKDLSHGRENVPVPCVNYYDGSLPEFCSYNTERTPTAGVPLNLDPDFLCGCDCTDDCQDKSKCACWKMTLEGARTIGLEGDNIGYVYRRLPEPLPSGIYECNSRCQCRKTCLNRVAQHPLQLKLQVFKTENRGWGIRALNDVPKGAFLCVYAGNLLTDATANLDGLNEGDEYLAELDYIEVVEGLKEGYEEDIPEKDKALDKKGSVRASEADSESESSVESEEEKEGSEKDDDFQPNAYFPQPQGDVFFQKSLRKRAKAKKKEEEKEKLKEELAAKRNADCITISDDEEVREPSRFTADDIADNDIRLNSRLSVRKLYGMDEACYIMDAKVQGNIGRYLNHSCQPNVFVQNVFVDTHDPRFPWVAFFALTNVVAGSELTWNYNYDVGSVPGKILYCFCGANDCRGRLL